MAMVAWRKTQLPEAEIVLVAKSHHNIKQSFYIAHIHAVLGGDGPRWQPLNVAVATSQWRGVSSDRRALDSKFCDIIFVLFKFSYSAFSYKKIIIFGLIWSH
jgi:hypothetical protein